MPKAKNKVIKRQATKAKPAQKSKPISSVVKRIREVVVPPATKSEPVLMTPLPQKEVRNFGGIPFESQANIIFNTFPADVAEIIGTTENSGAGTVTPPKISTT